MEVIIKYCNFSIKEKQKDVVQKRLLSALLVWVLI